MTHPLRSLFVAPLALLFSCLLLTNSATAASDPMFSDHRMHTLVYSNNEVFKIDTAYGYQSSIEFAEDERVKVLSLGEAAFFKVTPASNRIFVKALQNDQHTNMTVITNMRSYQFELSSRSVAEDEIVYVMRFYYPEAITLLHNDATNPSTNTNPMMNAPSYGALPAAGQPADTTYSKQPASLQYGLADPASVPGAYVSVDAQGSQTDTPSGPLLQVQAGEYNFNYRTSGGASFAPSKIFDNSQVTFLQLPHGSRMPDAYRVTPEGEEIPLQVQQEGEFAVIHGTYPIVALRYGPEIICVYNNTGSSITR